MNKRSQPKQTLLACTRKERGWTQAYVAQQVDVSVDTVRQWEGGRHFPYPVTIQKLCQLFQMAPGALGLLKKQDTFLSLKRDEIFVSTNEAASHNISEPSPMQAALTSLGMAERSTIKNESFFLQKIQGKWEPNEEEKKAAWELYVELVTRISIASLAHDEGILREALTSLYSLFQTARAILRSYGPIIAPSDTGTHLSVSYVVVRMLNTVVRPLLAKWHPLLKDYEELRPASVGVAQHEHQWARYTQLRQEIITVRTSLLAYGQLLAQIAEVSSLVLDETELPSSETSIRT